MAVNCAAAGVEESMLEHWFRGIKVEFRSVPPAVVLQDFPSVRKQLDVSTAELGRLAPLGKNHWYGRDGAPPDPRARLSRLIA